LSINSIFVSVERSTPIISSEGSYIPPVFILALFPFRRHLSFRSVLRFLIMNNGVPSSVTENRGESLAL